MLLRVFGVYSSLNWIIATHSPLWREMVYHSLQQLGVHHSTKEMDETRSLPDLKPFGDFLLILNQIQTLYHDLQS
jgi:hypothetical protein